MPPVVTRELAPLPERPLGAHKGDVGRLVVVGGCAAPVMMVGAPALVANAAYRSGVGLVQIITPAEIQTTVAGLSPLATSRALPRDELLRWVIERGLEASWAERLGRFLGDAESVLYAPAASGDRARLAAEAKELVDMLDRRLS